MTSEAGQANPEPQKYVNLKDVCKPIPVTMPMRVRRDSRCKDY